jgi:GNAT superfamily N-acetyltransferase
LADLYSSEGRVDCSRLKIEPYKYTQKLEHFCCTRTELDFFIRSDEVSKYEVQNFGKTKLVYYQGDVVAYFTTSTDSLKREEIKDYHRTKRPNDLIISTWPAIKIGRLAVDEPFQHMGIGEFLIVYIAGMALEQTTMHTAVRLIIVESYEESIEFYEKCGFRKTSVTRREKNRRRRGTTTMFLDLNTIGEADSEGGTQLDILEPVSEDPLGHPPSQ